MLAKTLQALGATFVLLLVAAAAAGFVVLKDRVRVVVAADQVAAGPDPQALLRDDVQTVGRTVDALQTAQRQDLEQLATVLEGRAAARHADLAAANATLARLGARLDEVQQAIAALQSAAAAAPTAVAVPLATATTASPPSAPGAAHASGPVPAEAAPAAATAPPARPAGTFLSFAVPAGGFRFGEPQDYTLVPELCRVGFDAKSTLHDFTGVTSAVRGDFHADLDDPQGAWTGEVVAQAATLLTGVDGRDANLREHLDTKQHAEIRFDLARFEPVAEGIDAAHMTARGDVVGTLTIRGKRQPFRMPVTVAVDPQRRVVVTGEAKLKLTDFDVPVPSQLGLINMQDEVVVWIALRARAAAGRPQ
jgi:polyisoprenoid-binding protein YceI